MDGQLDCHDGSKASIAQHGCNAKVFGVDDFGDDTMNFLFQHIHRHIALHLSRCRFLFGLRKGFLVHLLVLVERDTVDLHRHGGHHIWRLLLQDEIVQGFDVNLLICDDISRDKFATTLFVKSLHSGVLNAGELKNDAFNLFEFDTKTANFHLPILTSHELDVTIRKIAHDIASTVYMRVFFAGIEGVGNIDLSGFLWTVKIATAHLRSCDPKFTRSPHGQTITRFIDNIKLDVVQRRANRDVLHGLRHIEGGDADGAFSGAIEIGQRVICGRSQRRQFLAASQQVAQTMVLNGSGKLISYLRGHESVGNLLLFKIFVQRYHIQTQLLRNNVYRGTTRECRISFHHIGIETETGVCRDFTVRVEVKPTLIPLTKRDEVAMLQLTAFGRSRSARSVKHDEQRLRLYRS